MKLSSQMNSYSNSGLILCCRLDQLLSAAFPSGFVGASLRDIDDGYHRGDHPYLKPLSYDRLPVRVMTPERGGGATRGPSSLISLCSTVVKHRRA